MYSIVASDMDGTLLQPNHQLSTYTKETLKLLTERGIYFIFATGRHHIDIGQTRDALGISAYMITSNGARVHNADNELIFSHNIDGDIARALYQIVNHHPDIQTHVYLHDDWFINRETDEELEQFFQGNVFNYQLFDAEKLTTDGVCKVFFTCDDHQTLLPLEEAINARWGDRVNVSFSTLRCLEVMGGGVSKGHALEQVAKIMGHSLQECIAFGDGMNDMEMLSMAGKGCIMQNAHQRLKERLPDLEVIGSNADDAVPHYLRKIFAVK